MKFKHINNWFTSEERFLKTPVGIFLLGAFLGELSPDPTDAIHFWLQEHVFNNHLLSGPALVALQLFDWYFMSAFYFLLLLILAYILHIQKVHVVKRLTIVGGILGVGITVGILAQFITTSSQTGRDAQVPLKTFDYRCGEGSEFSVVKSVTGESWHIIPASNIEIIPDVVVKSSPAGSRESYEGGGVRVTVSGDKLRVTVSGRSEVIECRQISQSS